jgi:type I restriction enzyme S subunit
VIKVNRVKISELGETILGSTPSTKEPENYGGKIPFVRPDDMEEDKRKVEQTKKKLTEKGKQTVKNKLVPENSIMFSRRGSIGYTAITTEQIVTNGGIFSINPNEDYLNKYLYYKFSSSKVQNKLKRLGQGSTHPHITKKNFLDTRIKVHDKGEQRRIVGLLDAIDSKIELNRGISSLLEETAQSIYNSWFQAYEPYEEFKQTKQGKIPKQFQISKVGELLSLEYGNNLPEREREIGSVPVYGSNGIIDTHSESSVEGPSIIVGRKGTIGTINLEYQDFWPIDTTYYVDNYSENQIFYIKHLLQSLNLESFNEDAAVPGLNRNTVYNEEVAVPCKSKREDFNNEVKDIYNERHNLRKENKHLEELRDYLLPRLLSGEVVIDDDFVG